MNKLASTLLAASVAFIPAAALAQHGPRADGHREMRAGHDSRVIARHDGGRFRHPGRDFRHRRLQRGFVVHPFWFGPQFHIANWQMYGFANPGRDYRWVRYYDDAYMIDRGGRVRDARYGLDWDRYGERWRDDDGIPAYYGRGDFHPDEEDYAYVEEQDRYAYESGHDGRGRDGGWDYSQYGHGGYGYPPPSGGCHPAPPQPCGGYGPSMGHGYQQSYGYGYPVTIVETTVTTAGSATYVEEWVEEEVATTRRRVHRPRRARPPVRRAPPPPPPGERG